VGQPEGVVAGLVHRGRLVEDGVDRSEQLGLSRCAGVALDGGARGGLDLVQEGEHGEGARHQVPLRVAATQLEAVGGEQVPRERLDERARLGAKEELQARDPREADDGDEEESTHAGMISPHASLVSAPVSERSEPLVERSRRRCGRRRRGGRHRRRWAR